MTRRVAVAAGLATLAIVLCALPFATSNYLVRLATIAFMYVTLASSWNIIGGLTGYPSFATAAFFGLGAYGSGIVRVYASLPAAWLAGAAAAGLFALLIGPAILRLRGHYFAVASLVLAAVLREIVNGATSVTGGGMGLNLPGSTLLGVDATARLYYCSMLAAAAGTVALTVVIVRSRVGWALRCIEQNEDAATVLGINTLNAKVAALVASAMTTGLAGAIYATWIGYIDPSDAFDDILSIKPIVMAFLGGVGTVYGPVFGAVIFVALEELVWRNVLNFHAGILGIIIVFLLVFVPGGLGSFRHAVVRLRALIRPDHEARRGVAARAPVLPS
jgi:branched-chain amino acid transport system permease protein